MSEVASPELKNASESRFNSFVAIFVSLTATLMAIFNIKDGNIVQNMSQAQAHSIDTWSFYQAKSTKQHLAENTKEQYVLQLELSGGLKPELLAKIQKRITDLETNIKRYDIEKADLKAKAEAFDKQYNDYNFHDDQFDMSEALLSICIAIFGVAALTQKKSLLVFGVVLSSFGIAFGIAGFAGYNLHPDWLASFLS